MKTYNCKNPEENPMPRWMKYRGTAEAQKYEPASKEKDDPVTLFKKNPDAFFPNFPAHK